MTKLEPTPLQLRHATEMAEATFMLDRSDPGAGKTLTAIAALYMRSQTYYEYMSPKALIIVPTIVRDQWATQIADWFPHSSIHVPKNGKDLPEAHVDIIVTTYGLCRQAKMRMALTNWRPRQIILDECHNLKNHAGKTTQAILGQRRLPGIATGADWLLGLSGTLVRRYPDDVFPIVQYGAPQLLRKPGSRYAMTYDDFVREFCVTERRQFGGMRSEQTMVTGAKNTKALAKILGEVSVYRSLEEMAGELPETTYGTLNVPLNDKPILAALLKDEPELYEAMSAASDVSLDERLKDLLRVSEDRDNETFMPTVRNVIGQQKARDPDLIRYIQDLDRPVVIFGWHLDAIHALVGNLQGAGVSVGTITGSMTDRMRTASLDAFKAGDSEVLVGQIAAMGTGLDGLQHVCNHAIFLEKDWSPAMNTQAIARLRRMGQKYSVHVDTVVGDNFLDHALEETNNHKAAIMEELK